MEMDDAPDVIEMHEEEGSEDEAGSEEEAVDYDEPEEVLEQKEDEVNDDTVEEETMEKDDDDEKTIEEPTDVEKRDSEEKDVEETAPTKEKSPKPEPTLEEICPKLVEGDPKLGTDEDELLKKPPHSSEIFMGGIPRSLVQEELEELCAKYGECVEVRLLKDPSTGQNRGYAFVAFSNPESAQKAIKDLNGSELKGKKSVRVTLSECKHRLFIGNLPKSLTLTQVEAVMRRVEPGLSSLEAPGEHPGRDSAGAGAQHRGYAFADFYNTATAERCRKRMSAPDFRLGGRLLSVSWAEPKRDEDKHAPGAGPGPGGRMQHAAHPKVKSVHVSKLQEGTTEASLRKAFEVHGDIERVVIPAARAGGGPAKFAFVHFTSRAAAEAAAALEEVEHMDGKVQVTMARPPAREMEMASGNMRGRGPPAMMPPMHQHPQQRHQPYPRMGGPGHPREEMRGGGGGGGPMRGGGYMGGYGGGYARGGGAEMGPADGWGGRGFPGGGGGMNPMQAAGGMGTGGMLPLAIPQSAAVPLPTATAGMTMVPMMLPNGQVAYVLQQAGGGAGSEGRSRDRDGRDGRDSRDSRDGREMRDSSGRGGRGGDGYGRGGDGYGRGGDGYGRDRAVDFVRDGMRDGDRSRERNRDRERDRGGYGPARRDREENHRHREYGRRYNPY